MNCPEFSSEEHEQFIRGLHEEARVETMDAIERLLQERGFSDADIVAELAKSEPEITRIMTAATDKYLRAVRHAAAQPEMTAEQEAAAIAALAAAFTPLFDRIERIEHELFHPAPPIDVNHTAEQK